MPLLPTLDQLKQEFGLKNVNIVTAKTVTGIAADKAFTGIAAAVKIKHDKTANPYIGNITPGPPHDATRGYKASAVNAVFGSSVDKDYHLLGKGLSNPVYTSLTIYDGSYIDALGNQKSYKRIDLESILISVSFPRKIIKTEIQGRNGTVKEYIGEDDAQVTIQGIICGSNGVYPRADVNALLQVIQAPVAIPIYSDYLQNLGIHTLVFETRQINQVAGGYSYQPFTLNAVSDTPLELLISGG